MNKKLQWTLAILSILSISMSFITPSYAEVVTSESMEIIKPLDNMELTVGKNRVSYYSEGEKVVADLYIPTNYKVGEKRPAIIVDPPVTGVKEQTAGLYALELSKHGFITMAFDPRGFGDSEGVPLLENPYNIAEDIWNGVSYLRTLESVDQENIFSLGICGGAGFSYYATALDTRIKAIATLSPYLSFTDDLRLAFGDNGAAIRNFALANNATSQDASYAGQDTFLQIVPTTVEAIKTSTPIAVGMRDYYLPGKPGYTPKWQNALNRKSVATLFSQNIYDYAFMFDDIPVLTVYGSEAVSRAGGEKFYDMINGPKEEVIIEGAGHFDLYWMPEHVTPIAEKMASFYNDNLSVVTPNMVK